LPAGAAGVAAAATYVFSGATSFDAAQCCGRWVSEVRDAPVSIVAPLWRNCIFCSCWDAECRLAGFVFLRVILVTLAIPAPEISWGLLTVGPYVAETLAEVTLRQTCFRVCIIMFVLQA
jgi:hypothetical protein